VVEHWIEKRIPILHFLGAWNKSCRDDQPFLVAQIRGQIVDDVDKYPAIRFFVMIELGTVKRELHKYVILFNRSSLDSVQIIAAAGSVTVALDLPLCIRA